MATTFDVGGVLLERPFRIARLGHVGVNVNDAAGTLGFYRDALGFLEADSMDFATTLPPHIFPAELKGTLPETIGYFLRYGSDHHSLVVFPKCVMSEIGGGPPDVTINQLTWQVGSLQQVADARDWLEASGVGIRRSGRDMPGSNWHVYFLDPDGHVNELYYGMEQIGWDGLSKPRPMHDRVFYQPPSLPQISEQQEVAAALDAGVDLSSGTRAVERHSFEFDVEGVMLARPYKIVRLGPVGLFVADVDASLAFYRDTLGFTVTDERELEARRAVYLRTNTEHHSLALLDLRLRDALGMSPATTAAWIGVQVASYRQLCDAVAFLRKEGVGVREVEVDVIPGIDYGAWVTDPAGHAFLLYFGMEQVGADGRVPGTASRDRSLPWPETIPAQPHHYSGEPFLGPWG